jgi:hypothetical protein
MMTSTTGKTSRTIARCSAGFIAGALACASHGTPPQTATERTGFVGQSCPGLVQGSAPLDLKNARLFVEVVEVNSRELPQPVGDWLQHNAVKVRASANLVAFPDVPTSMPWGQCVDAVCSSMKFSLTVAAQLPGRASDPIGLALRIDEAAPEGSDAAARALLDTNLHVVNQEPTVLPPTPQVSDGSLVVTTYLLRSLDDLHRALECRVQQGEKEKAL